MIRSIPIVALTVCLITICQAEDSFLSKRISWLEQRIHDREHPAIYGAGSSRESMNWSMIHSTVSRRYALSVLKTRLTVLKQAAASKDQDLAHAIQAQERALMVDDMRYARKRFEHYIQTEEANDLTKAAWQRNLGIIDQWLQKHAPKPAASSKASP